MTRAQASQVTRHRARPRYLRAALALGLLGAGVALALAAHAGARPGLRDVEALAEQVERLPFGILARHRAYERAEASIYLRPWSGGRGAVCGRHQIAVQDITSPDGARLCALARTTLGGVAEIARQLDESRRWCAARPGRCACPWARLNYGDQTRLCRALAPGGDES